MIIRGIIIREIIIHVIILSLEIQISSSRIISQGTERRRKLIMGLDKIITRRDKIQRLDSTIITDRKHRPTTNLVEIILMTEVSDQGILAEDLIVDLQILVLDQPDRLAVLEDNI